MELPDCSVPDLLRLFLDGDESAFAELVRRYSAMVAAVVRRYRLQEADADDAAQTTWMRLVEHAGRIDDPRRLGGWLSSVAANECLAVIRRRRPVAPVDDLATVADPAPGVEERIVEAETVARVRRAVARLPEGRRELMDRLFADDPRPYAEIALERGIAVGSIGPTRARMIAAVRRDLAGEAERVTAAPTPVCTGIGRRAGSRPTVAGGGRCRAVRRR